MKPPICPIHNTEMYLLKGCHRESGGFVDNYWYCGECNYITKARNREEAEAESEWQIRSSDPEYVKSLSDKWKELDKKYPKPQPKTLRDEPVTEGEVQLLLVNWKKLKEDNKNREII